MRSPGSTVARSTDVEGQSTFSLHSTKSTLLGLRLGDTFSSKLARWARLHSKVRTSP